MSLFAAASVILCYVPVQSGRHFMVGEYEDRNAKTVAVAVALSTGAELLYNEGHYREASELADMAWQADPGWQRNIDHSVETVRAQAHPQEDN